MNADCKIALTNYIGSRMSGAVFIGKRSPMPIRTQTIELIAKNIASLAGCHVTATVHIYRKTFASITYRRTNDILLVSKLLGHAATEVTLKCYLVDDVCNIKSRFRMAM